MSCEICGREDTDQTGELVYTADTGGVYPDAPTYKIDEYCIHLEIKNLKGSNNRIYSVDPGYVACSAAKVGSEFSYHTIIYTDSYTSDWFTAADWAVDRLDAEIDGLWSLRIDLEEERERREKQL